MTARARMGHRARILLVALVTVASLWLTAARLTLSGDLTSLFPDKGDAAALGRFTRAFGGGDLAMFLVRGDAPDEVEAVAHALGDALATKPSVVRVTSRFTAPRSLDPTLAWAYAGPAAREKLAAALTPEGMRARLEETRSLLLAPGSGSAEEWLAKDPLRLAAIPWEARSELAAGLTVGEDGTFVADGGKARLVVAQPRGSAFDSTSAGTFVAQADDAIRAATAGHPGVRVGVSGGHAIAQATERMIRTDLEVSGTVSMLLASLVFLFTFRRARALLAVLPPLILGTAWTMGLCAIVSPGLTAISIGFMAVVVGVGVDTGVHVYSALLDARREGLSPHDAALRARGRTWRPTLLAAVAAGLAFGSLALSELGAIRQLGVLCGVGEVLTAIAILEVTPVIGARLERGAPPAPLAPAWIRALGALSRTRKRAAWTFAASLVPVVLVAFLGWPSAGQAVVALRPHALPPLVVQDQIYALFGGQPGQWVVLTIDANEARAEERADRVAEALERAEQRGDIAGFDAITRFAPSPATQRARLDERDRLDLPALRARLEAALVAAGFDPDACAPALDAFSHPSHDVTKVAHDPDGPLAWLVSRHRAFDAGDTLVAAYVRPWARVGSDPSQDGRDERALAAIHEADPGAVVTGYAHLEVALKRSLARDLPRVALLALVVVAIALGAALRRARDVGLALLTVVIELSIVAMLMRALHLRWHVYDALVLPVLIGITIDEAMFLLHAARDGAEAGEPAERAVERTLRAQGPLVASTALTTAAGFAALLACRFDGLFDLGAVGALGSVAGLVCALVVVPAGVGLAPLAKKAQNANGAMSSRSERAEGPPSP